MQRGWRARLATRILETPVWLRTPVFFWYLMSISFLIFHVGGFAGKILGSESICTSDLLVERMSMVLPKLTTDCRLVATTLSSHPYRDVAIVLDLWLLLVFSLSLVLGVFYIGKIVGKYREPSYRNYPRRKKLGIFAMYTGLVCLCFWGIFFHSVLVIPGSWSWGATLASYGFGAMLQTIVAGIPYLFFQGYYHNRLIKWSDRK